MISEKDILEYSEVKITGDDPGDRTGHYTWAVIPGTCKALLVGEGDPKKFYSINEGKFFHIFDMDTKKWELVYCDFPFSSAQGCFLERTNVFYMFCARKQGKMTKGFSTTESLRSMVEFEVPRNTKEMDEKCKVIVGERYTDDLKFPRSRVGHFIHPSPIDDKSIIIGFGFYLDYLEFLKDLWKYDVISKSWEEIKPIFDKPRERVDVASVVLKEQKKILMFGGYTEQGNSNDLWEFSFETYEWAQLEFENQEKVLPRSNHQMLILNEEETRILVGPGMYKSRTRLSDSPMESLTSFWELNLVEKRWKLVEWNKDSERIHRGYKLIQHPRTKEVFLFGGSVKLLFLKKNMSRGRRAPDDLERYEVEKNTSVFRFVFRGVGRGRKFEDLDWNERIEFLKKRCSCSGEEEEEESGLIKKRIHIKFMGGEIVSILRILLVG